ncbi:ABC transporter permease subunit [Sinorhizobium meliloti]|jgi:polar amino acid transport system permease protein|uniref:amino acid ABC transporter permease n=1 Tax=Rhizobium meliloti TaxID=382 RepID=UPI0002A55762|nr:amino acid ABC transporter permease [Sinorhizobium meliloti]MDX1066429.1 ABC transporter permease subunit [Sinorhizobium medicae]AGA08354.1 amine acid ABC transporter, permease protein, 3-TM region, His/Glu/Gln/Arg/opine family [Sinorhizobium meliloti GR4]ASQ06021.1 amino acid ABC transporter permease [Sinorhizobium meliloti]MDE3831982.1 amino acid ABC transporter permease [Sinorhizobium meliloti]MDE4580265.1 amino acid ABC transporter permease [Sinorhizobium meliloti]
MGYQLDFGKVLQGEYLELILQGVQTTMVLFVLSWIFGLVLAIVLTVVRAIEFRPTQWLVAAFVEYHRNVPVLIQLFVWYFGFAVVLPDAVNDYLNEVGAEIGYAIVALALNKAAYMSEDFRSGMRSIHPAQMEAARSIGLTYLGAMRWVILPQAWRLALPALLGQTLILFKGTSLAAGIGVAELSYQARYIEEQSFRIFEAYGIATAIYMLICFAIMWLSSVLSERFRLRVK